MRVYKEAHERIIDNCSETQLGKDDFQGKLTEEHDNVVQEQQDAYAILLEERHRLNQTADQLRNHNEHVELIRKRRRTRTRKYRTSSPPSTTCTWHRPVTLLT